MFMRLTTSMQKSPSKPAKGPQAPRAFWCEPYGMAPCGSDELLVVAISMRGCLLHIFMRLPHYDSCTPDETRLYDLAWSC